MIVIMGLTRVLVNYATSQKVDLLANTHLSILSMNFLKSTLYLVPAYFVSRQMNSIRAFFRPWDWIPQMEQITPTLCVSSVGADGIY